MQKFITKKARGIITTNLCFFFRRRQRKSNKAKAVSSGSGARVREGAVRSHYLAYRGWTQQQQRQLRRWWVTLAWRCCCYCYCCCCALRFLFSKICWAFESPSPSSLSSFVLFYPKKSIIENPRNSKLTNRRRRRLRLCSSLPALAFSLSFVCVCVCANTVAAVAAAAPKLTETATATSDAFIRFSLINFNDFYAAHYEVASDCETRTL